MGGVGVLEQSTEEEILAPILTLTIMLYIDLFEL